MEWAKTAKVGDKVVCVDADGIYDGKPQARWLPEEAIHNGQVYTIAAMWSDSMGVVFDLRDVKRSKSVVIRFWPARVGYSARRFRPLAKRPTDISIFTRMLTDTKVTIDA